MISNLFCTKCGTMMLPHGKKLKCPSCGYSPRGKPENVVLKEKNKGMVVALIAHFDKILPAQEDRLINFVINEGRMIGQNLYPIFGVLFLLAVSIMLFQTQLGIMDSTSRIMAENAAIAKLKRNSLGKINLSRIYFIFVWAQITFGIILFLLNIYEPKTLIILGAVINAFAMFVHTALVAWLNHRSLPKVFQPSWFRKIVIAIIFIFFGFFSVVVLLDKVGVLNVNI